MKDEIFSQKGVTLIELMVAMAIAGIVAAAMFAFQHTQTRSYVTQEALTNMQQNARAAMHFMIGEIRMAGCDPEGSADARIVEASDSSIRFTMDYTGGGGTPESINLPEVLGADNAVILGTAEYTPSVPSGAIDQPGEDITYQLNGDGDLERIDNFSGESSVIARNFDALEFVYVDEDGDRIHTNGANLTATDRQQIRSVHVTILARSGRNVPGFMYQDSDTRTYTNPWSEAGDDPLYTANDNFRRILLSTETIVRNLE